MLRNCVILVHTNMFDATHLVQINMDVETQQRCQPVDSAGRFVAKKTLKRKTKNVASQKHANTSKKLIYVAPPCKQCEK